MTSDETPAAPGRSVFTDARLRQARLVREDALVHARAALSAHGHAEDADALDREARRRVGYLERCHAEAQAVLGGDLGAATRLWLLLREPVCDTPLVPASVLEQAAAQARSEPPRILDGDALLRLVAGVVRAANQPVEAHAMLKALGRLLEPLLLFDYAARAAADAPPLQDGALRTLLVARRAPEWRDALRAFPGPEHIDAPAPAPDPTGPPLDLDRVPFERGSWLNPVSNLSKGIGISAWPCLDEARLGMSRIDVFGDRYDIVSLSNTEACPGQPLTIRGTGFGPRGRVVFPSPALSDPAFQLGVVPGHPMLAGVEPVRWTDNEIDVVVPAWATSGELRLRVFTTHRDHCIDVDVHRLGNSVFFRGGLARVFKAFLNSVEVDLDSPRRPNIDPKDVTTLSWQASSGPNVRISARLVTGSTLWEANDLPGGFGATLIHNLRSVPSAPTYATLVLSAHGPCGMAQPLNIPVFLSVRPRLTIEYVEVTQGVQGDRGDVEAGRGMPLVALKDTAVRVHLACDRGGWFGNRLDRITGSLKVDGHSPLPPTNVRPHVPDAGFVAVEGLSRPEFTDGTLNFKVPAAWLTPGAHTLAVRVVCDDPGGRIDLGQAVAPTWHFKLPLRVRCLYLGRRTNYRVEDLLAYAREALDLIPTPLTDIGVIGRYWHDRDLGAGGFWNDLAADVEDAWDDAEQPEALRWLGIVPASEAVDESTKGIAKTPGTVALARSDRPDVAAHELGHSSGLQHVNLPLGTPPPHDWADNGGLLRRPPFDERSGEAVPLPAGDLMSYLMPIRPGITTWVRLFNKVF